MYEKTREIIVIFRINWWGATLSKMGLRGMQVRYFVKIEIYFAVEVVIIYQDFFSRKCFFFYSNLNHFIARAPFRSCIQMNPLELMTIRIPINDRSRIVLEYFKHLI